MKAVPKQRITKKHAPPTRKGAVRTKTRPAPIGKLPTKTMSIPLPLDLAERVRKECDRRGLPWNTFGLLVIAIALPQFEQGSVALRVP